ncbi:MAG: GNAT family N-acetyltransferase [Gammaproteobacteria bacterium]
MDQIRIAPAGIEDVPVIHEMIGALADHLGFAHELVATEGDLHDALFGARPRAEVVLAYVGDAPAGFVLFYNNYSTFRGRCGIHVEDLYVLPAWRGKRIGRRLLAHIARLTLERGCSRLEWWVLARDERASRFYEQLGATAKDEWTVYRLKGEPLVQLAREVQGREPG